MADERPGSARRALFVLRPVRRPGRVGTDRTVPLPVAER